MLRSKSLLLFCPIVCFTSVYAEAPRTVWSGIYSPQQVARGESLYSAACSRCHHEDSGGYMGLRGEKFIENWREDSLKSLWVRVSKTMPVGAPASLQQSEYLDILAYILHENGFPIGNKDLTAVEIPEIRFEGKEGAEPVPDFALVQTVGCLTKDRDGSWRVRHGREPIRTRNPEASSQIELRAESTGPLGDHTFRILDGSRLNTESHDGRMVELKGFLIRKPNDNRINATSVQILGSRCR